LEQAVKKKLEADGEVGGFMDYKIFFSKLGIFCTT
jgi:hypothetical protein